MLSYVLIEPLGFYTAMFTCMLVMLVYGMLFVRHRKINTGNLARTVILAFGIAFVEYACFAWQLRVPTPAGLWV